MASCPRCLCNSKWWTGLKRIPLSSALQAQELQALLQGSHQVDSASIAARLDPFHPMELRWAEVQANKDYAARFHRDKNNLGPSWIMAHFASSRGNFLGLFQKKMETQNSIVYHGVFHIKKGYRCIPYLKTNLFWPQDGWLCIWASGVHLFLYCRNRPSNGSNIVVRTLGVHSFHQVHIGNLMKPDVTNGLFENWIP